MTTSVTTVVNHSKDGKPYGVGNVVLRLKQKETLDSTSIKVREKLKLGKTQNAFTNEEFDLQQKEFTIGTNKVDLKYKKGMNEKKETQTKTLG